MYDSNLLDPKMQENDFNGGEDFKETLSMKKGEAIGDGMIEYIKSSRIRTEPV